MAIQKNNPDHVVKEEMSEMWTLLSHGEQQVFIDNFHIHTYKKNQIIYSEGEQPEHLMCLLKGKVKIFKNGVGGRNQIVRLIRPIQYFGYRAYFAHEAYVTAASAFETASIGFVPMSVVETLIRENNKLAFFFIKELAVDLGVSDARTVNLTQKHIRGRLAEALIFLKTNYGLEEDGATLNIYMAREDLANLSNMTTSNAIRTLSCFSNEKIIIVDGRKIKIIDEERLKRISRCG